MRIALIALVVCALALADEKVVYGTDNRQDVCESNSQLFKGITREAIVALIPEGAVQAARTSGNTFDFSSASNLQSAFNLCSDQRFLLQPTSASCSGTLVGPDRVLTAGHCISSCADGVRFVFNYFLDGNDCTMPTITEDDVYSCLQVQSVLVSLPDGVELDHAIVLLDRPVVGRQPVTVESDPNVAITDEQQVTVIGMGSGIPAKIDSGGRVISPRADTMDFFTATTDTFGGNSGSGAFDNTGKLVGILVRGAPDYIQRGDCQVVNNIPCDDVLCSNLNDAESLSYPFRAMQVIDCHTSDDCEPNEACFRSCAPDDTSCTGMCGSNNTCSEVDLGDGFCDRQFNTAECDFDGGDCCRTTCQDADFTCGVAGFECRDPNANETLSFCSVVDLADGFCDSEFNTPECGFDGGDCCESTCQDAEFTCGVVGFDCRDPSANETACSAVDIADGFCDRQFNTPECGFDGGDCCESTCQDANFECGIVGFDCLDPDANQTACSPIDIGDGFCDRDLNTAECDFDGGDCCESTCQDAAFSCGTFGFQCLDPSAGDSAGSSLQLGWAMLTMIAFGLVLTQA